MKRITLLAAGLLAAAFTAPAVSAKEGSLAECAVAEAPEGFQSNLFRSWTASYEKDAEIEIDERGFLLIVLQCFDGDIGDRAAMERAALIVISAALKDEAAGRLEGMGLDLAQVDAVMLPIMKQVPVKKLLNNNLSLPEELETEAEERFNDLIQASGIEGTKVETTLAAYLIGMIGDILDPQK